MVRAGGLASLVSTARSYWIHRAERYPLAGPRAERLDLNEEYITSPFQPRDPDFEHRVRSSFARQAAMHLLGVSMERVAPGEVDLILPFRGDLTQQHGFLHAGIVAAVVDSACGYAALSLMEPGTAVLSVEFKVQLLAPARGASFRALGRVVRAGRTLTFVMGELRVVSQPTPGEPPSDGELIALMTGSMMTVRDRPELAD
jgi:uncharacterized protein (TIGR00369 family)